MNALIGGCLVPDLETGPRHSFSADFAIRFMARVNSETEMVQPVMIPFSSICQEDVVVPEETLSLKHL